MNRFIVLLIFMSVIPLSFAQNDGRYTGWFTITGTMLKKPTCIPQRITALNLGSMLENDKNGQWRRTEIKFTNCGLASPENNTGNPPGVYLSVKPDTVTTPELYNSGLWSNRYGDAENVGIKLKINDREIPPAGTGTTDLYKAIPSGGEVIFSVMGQMVALEGRTIKAGSVGTTISLIVTYK